MVYGSFYVSPRYTPGSPGRVSEVLAERIAQQEADGYKAALSGIFGLASKVEAEKLGLAGIVEEQIEIAHGWRIRDLLTGRVCRRYEERATKLQRGDVILEVREGNYNLARYDLTAPDGFPFKVDRVDRDSLKARVVADEALGAGEAPKWDPSQPKRRLILGRAGSVKIERGES